MKTKHFLLTTLLIVGYTTAQAQFFKKLKEKVNTTVNSKINNTVDKAINKTTNKVVDSTAIKIEKVAKDVGQRKNDKKSVSDKKEEENTIPETEKPIVPDSTARKENR